FFLPAEDGIRARNVTGVQTCALPISLGETREKSLLLVFRAVPHEHVTEHEMRAEDTGQAHPAACELLEHDGERRVIHRAAAVFRSEERRVGKSVEIGRRRSHSNKQST